MTLTDLCLAHIARHLPAFAPDLSTIPLDLAERLFQHALAQPPSSLLPLLALHIFAYHFWNPWEIKLGSAATITGQCGDLLSLFADSLVRLDLSRSLWLGDLAFLTRLRKLQCLNLSRSTFKLDSQQVSYIASLPSLRCLSLEYGQATGEPEKKNLEQLLAGV
jgi:hypothetical protein